MKLSLDLRTALTQTLTPQQIQYLKLLQLPVIQLEQHVMQEIEQNPMLEDFSEGDLFDDEVGNLNEFDDPDGDGPEAEITDRKTEIQERQMISDEGDPFEFHKMIYQDDQSYEPKPKNSQWDEEDSEPFQIKDAESQIEDLTSQLKLTDLSEEEQVFGEQVIGNIDNDGYLRRDLAEIIDETNMLIAEINFNNKKIIREISNLSKSGIKDNPARQFALSEDSKTVLQDIFIQNPDLMDKVSDTAKNYIAENIADNGNYEMLKEIDEQKAEKVLREIRHLDPPGIGSRTIQECLVSQLEIIPRMNAAEKLAMLILTDTYDAFAKKHFHVITKTLGVTDDYLKEAIEVIRSLNPKPGGGDYQSEINTVIPDFVIEIDDESKELTITVNDSRIPSIKLSQAYEKLKKEAQFKRSNKETKEWIRNKYEDAKFLIQAIRQRKSTMLKVMTAIAYLQKGFFFEGTIGLKPLIYKNVAEKTGLDISTVCRIVNGKYCLTPFGTFELKFFFSESLPTDEGEEVSTKVIKQVIQDIVAEESKKKPYSDDKISKLLKEKGYNVARRTVAKYREQLKIPVARLRKEL